MSKSDRSMVEQTYAWYTDAIDPLGMTRAVNWLADIEARVIAASITANCCDPEDLLEQARTFILDHPTFISADTSADDASALLADLLERIHERTRPTTDERNFGQTSG